CFQAFAKKTKPCAIEVKHLRSLAALTHKHKQITRGDVSLHRSFDKGMQSVEGLAHVAGLAVRVDTHASEGAQHPSFLQIATTSSRLNPSTHVPAGPRIESDPQG